MDGKTKLKQLELFPSEDQNPRFKLSSTFVNNMSLPIHRWFRFTAGFSASWVNDLIQSENAKRVLDPFSGSGTVMLESEFLGIQSIGVEAHPYIHRIANAKLSWRVNPEEFKSAAKNLLIRAKSKQIKKDEFPGLIDKCYPLETNKKLQALKEAWWESKDRQELKELNWFIITAILRVSSNVGTAQWQYVLPNKSKGKVLDPYDAFEVKIYEMAHDMGAMQRLYPKASKAEIFQQDARKMVSVPDKWADLVITSPPYANNYDYADATRLEMTFWEEINGWGDLQEKVRQYLVRACTQHVASLKKQADVLLASELLSPIKQELNGVFRNLDEIRQTKGGKKNYHLMILAYFYDLAQIFFELRRTTQTNSKVCFVVGDSAPYGIYVPVDKWLGELALAAGFHSYQFEKLRDRNIKWKNRKHTVPLKEGRLWIYG